MTVTRSKIEWCDSTWNPTTGCTKVSSGCDICYAEKITERFHGKGSFAEVKLHHDRIDAPLRWRKPRRVFVNSMSDLFHDKVPDEFIARVWAVMAATPKHTYQILTKRHGRMRALLNDDAFHGEVAGMASALAITGELPSTGFAGRSVLPNVWLGVSVEDQKRADLRIPALLDTPAAVRFLSCEPLIGSVDLAGRGWLPVSAGDPDPDAECKTCGTEEFSDQHGHETVHRCGSRHAEPCRVLPNGDCDLDGEPTGEWCNGPIQPYPRISWVISGGESGSGARPAHPDWFRSLRDQCQAAGVPYFFKQWGEWAPRRDSVDMVRVGKKQAGRELDGRTWDEFPGGESRV
jgi:protein gp37